MIQNPVVPHNTRPVTFPLVLAEACTCCGRELNQGYDVPYVGVVGPKCVRKYAALAAALARLDMLTITPAHPMEARRAVNNLVLVLRTRIGYAVELVDQADGNKSIQVGARTREYSKVCKTWRERRAEFELELQMAEAHLVPQAAPAPAEAPVLTEEDVAAMPLAERRALAVEHGILTGSGKPSTSVTLIWAAMQIAQVAEAQPLSEPAPLRPALVLENPVTGPAFLPYAVGPFQQVEQRHYAGGTQPMPVTPRCHPPLPERLHRVALELKAHEVKADPGSPERLLRGLRADRMAGLAWIACHTSKQGSPLLAGTTQRNGRGELQNTLTELEAEADAAWNDFWNAKGGASEDLCERLYGLWREASERVQAAHFNGPHKQLQQRQAQATAPAPVVLVDCAECEGKGRALYEVGQEFDGSPLAARLTCAVCHGAGKMPVVCPECLGAGIALVTSDWGEPSDEWFLKCALEAIEHGDGYTPEQVAEIRAQAAAAGLLVPQPQPEQQQAQGLTEEEHDRLLEFELDAQDAQEAATRRPVSTRRPLTEHEQEDRWQQDDLMERRAAFLREDY